MATMATMPMMNNADIDGQHHEQLQSQLSPEILLRYNAELEKAFENRDGTKAASLLEMRSVEANQAMEVYITQGGNKVARLSEPWEKLPQLVEKRFIAAAAIHSNDWIGAAAHLGEALMICINALQKDDKWGVPIMHKMAADLRVLSEQADQQAAFEKKKGDSLEKAERILKKGFSITVNDRSGPEESKEVGALEMINQLFKIYFRLNNLRLCGNLIRTIDRRSGQDGPDFESMYSTAHRVTYKFFTGRLHLYEGNYSKAGEDLAYAFHRIPAKYMNNKRLTLLYLIPARMLKGILPKNELLEKYNMLEFQDIARGIRSGNVALYNQAFKKHEESFIRKGLYLVVGKLKYLVYRTLCMRLHRITDTPKIKLDYYIKCLGLCDVHMTFDEVECIIANLIYKGYIKGYIAHTAKYLVVSRNTPFPPIHSVA